jgi:hypothetical protein
MKVTKRQLLRIIKEEKDKIQEEETSFQDPQDPTNGDHHWPRIEWDTPVGELTDKWHDMEMAAFDPKDTSMTQDDELSTADAKDLWREQVDQASYDLENELTVEVRKVALKAMKDITNRLINGDYA